MRYANICHTYLHIKSDTLSLDVGFNIQMNLPRVLCLGFEKHTTPIRAPHPTCFFDDRMSLMSCCKDPCGLTSCLLLTHLHIKSLKQRPFLPTCYSFLSHSWPCWVHQQNLSPSHPWWLISRNPLRALMSTRPAKLAQRYQPKPRVPKHCEKALRCQHGISKTMLVAEVLLSSNSCVTLWVITRN